MEEEEEDGGRKLFSDSLMSPAKTVGVTAERPLSLDVKTAESYTQTQSNLDGVRVCVCLSELLRFKLEKKFLHFYYYCVMIHVWAHTPQHIVEVGKQPVDLVLFLVFC